MRYKTVEQLEVEHKKLLERLRKVFDIAKKIVEAGFEIGFDSMFSEIWFKSDDNTLPARMSAKLGLKFSKSSHQDHVDYFGTLDGVAVTVWGVVPHGCRVEYEEIQVPEHIERRARIICEEKENAKEH